MDETLRQFDRRQRKWTGARCFAWGMTSVVVALLIGIVACGRVECTGRYIPTNESEPIASQGSVGTSLPVASTATTQPTPDPTHTAIPTATPALAQQPTYTPPPSHGHADTPTPVPVATPGPTPQPSPTVPLATPTTAPPRKPTPIPTPTAPPVTPTPAPISVDVTNVSFVGAAGYTLYLEIPGVLGDNTHEQMRLVVTGPGGVIKEESQGFVQARNGNYVGAVVIDQLPNPDIEWVRANLTVHAIPQRGNGMINVSPDPTIAKPWATVVPTTPPEIATKPSPTPPRETATGPRSEYLMGLINKSRREHGLSPVTLGDNESAQKHAESMLQHSFAGHWGLDGLTPIMRYTLAGGVNYARENTSGVTNVKWGPHFAKRDWKESLRMAHNGLMNSSGHRKNILDTWHRKVSLGNRLQPMDLRCSPGLRRRLRGVQQHSPYIQCRNPDLCRRSQTRVYHVRSAGVVSRTTACTDPGTGRRNLQCCNSAGTRNLHSQARTPRQLLFSIGTHANSL